MRHYSGRKVEIQHNSRISLFQWGDVLITISSLDSKKKCLNDKTLLQPLGQSLVLQKVKSITSTYNEYNSLLTTKLVSVFRQFHVLSDGYPGRPGKPDENQISNPGGPDLPAKSSKPPSRFQF